MTIYLKRRKANKPEISESSLMLYQLQLLLYLYSLLVFVRHYYYITNCSDKTKLKGIKTAVQLGPLVRFLYHSKTNYSKRGAYIAASGKAFDY